MTPELLAERAWALLDYDPASGLLTWRVSRGKAKAGDVAGVADARGYIVVGLCGKRLYAHRLAFLLATGSWPSALVDHVDGDRSNNRFANLRDVSNQVNQQNQRAASRNNSTGLLGVRRVGKRFRAQLSVEGVPRYLGTFDTAERAHAAYVDAKRQLHAGSTL